MFCIAAFIVLAIISIFSASQRKLAKKAWDCTLHRITFRPCDTNFKEEAKSKLLGHVAKRTPKLIKAADIGIEVASFLLVILTVWSILSVLNSGLNLFVWGTCNPSEASSCSLSSETCSIEKVDKSLWQYIGEGKPFDWFSNGFGQLINTFANIPNRLKNWDATEYLPKNVSYYHKYDSSKSTAIEILDPGCSVCARLFKNIKESGFEDKYNLAYISYPIKNPYSAGKYKFTNSYTATRYLESIKLNPLENATAAADWQIIEKIFTEKDSNGISYQSRINNDLDQAGTTELIEGWLKNIGYSDAQIAQIKTTADSQAVVDAIDRSYSIVEKDINTLKIPTIVFGGKRLEGLVEVNSLK